MVLPKRKLHQLFFCLLVLFLPTQLGKHFWPDWTMVLGLRLDYLSPTLYLTDVIIIGILVSWAIEKFTINSLIFNFQKYKWCFLFFVYLFFSCLLANNQSAAFYKLAKIIEFSFLGFYVAKNIKIDRLFNYLIAGAVIYSSSIAIFQFINQRSLGGIFYWLGERNFNAGTPGIAQTVWNGQLLLRPYATFPHPNVLAGFLVVGMILLFNSRNLGRLTPGIAIILGTIALFLTFSHIAWVVFILSLVVYFFVIPSEVEGSRPQPRFARFLHSPFRLGRNDIKMRTNKKKIFIVSIFLLFAFYFLLSTFPIQSESITYRQDLNLAAIKEWQSSLLFGVGLNNFLVRLPEFYQSSGEIRWFQPAHNIFLMVLAETGLIGLIGLIWFLIKTIRRLLLTANYQLLITLVAILVLGLFDHYFYTLQQGQLLMTLVFGLAWSTPSKNDKITS